MGGLCTIYTTPSPSWRATRKFLGWLFRRAGPDRSLRPRPAWPGDGVGGAKGQVWWRKTVSWRLQAWLVGLYSMYVVVLNFLTNSGRCLCRLALSASVAHTVLRICKCMPTHECCAFVNACPHTRVYAVHCECIQCIPEMEDDAAMQEFVVYLECFRLICASSLLQHPLKSVVMVC